MSEAVVRTRNIVWLALFLVSLSAFGADKIEDPCALFARLSPEAMLSVRPEFLAKHNTTYKIEIDEAPIRNQCQYGGCWAYQGISFLERAILRATGKTTDLSEPYLIARDLQLKSRSALEEPGHQIKPSGLFEDAMDVVERYGVVPQSAWAPRVPFESGTHGDRLLGFLNDRAARFHYDSQGKSLEEISVLKEKAIRELDAILESYMGPLPTAFTHEGVAYASPEEYWKKTTAPLGRLQRVHPKRDPLPEAFNGVKTPPKAIAARPLTPPLPVKTKAEPGTVVQGKPPAIVRELPEMANDIIDVLKKGGSVPISIEINHNYIDKATGIMAIKAFPAPDGLKPVPFVYRNHFQMTGGHHAMEIVGADFENGRLIKFKVRNTWGEKSGDHGYYHLYPDYFKEYVNAVYLPEKPTGALPQ